MKICASNNEVCTHCPSPVRSLASSASTMPLASRMPAEVSLIAIPTRTGPCPGRPVIDMSPPMPCADLIDPGAPLIGAVLPKAGDAAIDDARVDLADGIVIDAEAVLHRRFEILDDDIGLLGQFHKDRQTLPGLQVR